MAIKLPDPGNGIPEQKTGNDEWTNMKIVRDNFADQSNAASRLVGTANGQIPLAEQVSSRAFSGQQYYTAVDLKSATTPPILWIERSFEKGVPDTSTSPVSGVFNIISFGPSSARPDYKAQLAITSATTYPEVFVRTQSGYSSGVPDVWTPITSMKSNYLKTSALAANVVMDADGNLLRSSSSLKYKDVIAKLEIDSDLYNKAMSVKPIVYRSKSEADPDDWHFMSFSAEELGELDPALTYWKTHDDVRDEQTGEVTKVKLDKKEAEGINLNAICAVLHATNIYQDKKLKELEKRLSALEG